MNFDVANFHECYQRQGSLFSEMDLEYFNFFSFDLNISSAYIYQFWKKVCIQ